MRLTLKVWLQAKGLSPDKLADLAHGGDPGLVPGLLGLDSDRELVGLYHTFETNIWEILIRASKKDRYFDVFAFLSNQDDGAARTPDEILILLAEVALAVTAEEFLGADPG